MTMTETITIPTVEEIDDMLNEALREGRPQVFEVAGRRFAVAADYDHDGWHVATDMTMPEGTEVYAWDAPRGYVPILSDETVRDKVAELLKGVPGGIARRLGIALRLINRHLPQDVAEKEQDTLREEVMEALRDDGVDSAVELLEDNIIQWVSEPAHDEDFELLEEVAKAAGVPLTIEYACGYSQGESYYAVVPGDPGVERPFARYLLDAAKGDVFGVRVAMLDKDGEVENEDSVWGLVGSDFVANDGVEFVIGAISGWLK